MKTKVRTKKTKKATKSALWERVGVVGVDSGQLMIVDPMNVDGQWLRDQEPAGHPAVVLTAKGRARFPELKSFRAQYPFKWGSYASPCPELGMSINEARAAELVADVDLDPTREFSYRGACDVSHLKGEDFGQLHYRLGHAGAGVAFSSGYGDGVYPVYARRNEDGRIVEARIVMG